jgi:hypothetical protein
MALYITKSATGLVTEALGLLQVVDGESPISSSDLEAGARQLGMLLNKIQAEGATLWMRRRLSLDLIEGEKDYILSDNAITALDVIQASTATDEDGTNEIPATMISRRDYMAFNNKLSTGRPTQVWFHSDEDDGPTVTVWPIPDDDYVLFLDHREPFSTITNATTLIEIPDYWVPAVVYGTAKMCALPFGKTGASGYAVIEREAKDLYDTAAAFDIAMDGDGTVQFAPGP